MAGVCSNTTLTIAYMNIRGQTGLDVSKQLQIENFIKSYRIDILNCQEINVLENSFSQCEYIGETLENLRRINLVHRIPPVE